MTESNNYYVYAYLRKDGTPYYIGKGTGYRCFSKQHTIKPPIDKNRIVIMENNLTEVGALALERFYIRWYGRKDLKEGILRNGTDGGDGFPCWQRTTEEKRKVWSKKISIANSKPKPEWVKEKFKGPRPHFDQKGGKNNNAKRIKTPFGTFNSIRDASDHLDIAYDNVHYKLRAKHSGWEYIK